MNPLALLVIAVAFIALIALCVVLKLSGEARWRHRTDELRRALLGARAPAPASRFDPHELADLPAPVQRYFRAVLPPGQPAIRRAHLAWRGEMNLGKPGKDNWKPFTAAQDFVPAAPGFLWDARVSMAPGLPVLVRDAFVNGAGSMRGALLGWLPVVRTEGTLEIAAAALQRYLGEAAWFPTALLPSHGVEWTRIDGSRALATIRGGSTTVSVEFRFAADGTIDSIHVPDRLFDNGRDTPVLRPWQGRNLSYRRHQGILVPDEAIVEWQLPTGPFAYWRGRPTAIEYE